MSDVSIEINLPLDADGFLSRECPDCERQFKWKPTSSNTDRSENAEIESYYCPYCYRPASPNNWWTKEQFEYAKQIAFKQVLESELRNLQRRINQASNASSLIQMKASMSESPEPEPLEETIEGLMLVEFPCHLEEPLKVDEGWQSEIACLICGIRYPADLVKPLPE